MKRTNSCPCIFPQVQNKQMGNKAILGSIPFRDTAGCLNLVLQLSFPQLLATLGLSLTYPIAAFLLLDFDCKHFGTVTISWTIQQAPRRLPVSVYRVEMPMLAPSGREMVSDCIMLPRGMYNFKLKECVFICVYKHLCAVCACVFMYVILDINHTNARGYSSTTQLHPSSSNHFYFETGSC